MSDVAVVIDEVPHALSKERGWTICLDGTPLAWKLTSDEKTNPKVDAVFSMKTHVNLASSANLRALMSTFIARLVFDLPLRPMYYVNWDYLACSPAPSSKTPNVQRLPGKKLEVEQFNFHAAIVAAGVEQK